MHCIFLIGHNVNYFNLELRSQTQISREPLARWRLTETGHLFVDFAEREKKNIYNLLTADSKFVSGGRCDEDKIYQLGWVYVRGQWHKFYCG